MRVIILEAGEAHYCWTNVGMVGENLAGPAFFTNTGPHKSKPGVCDLLLKVAMVPCVTRARLRKAVRNHSRAWRRRICCRKIIVRISKQDEVWRPVWIRRDHVKQALLRVVGERRRDLIGVARDDIEAGEAGCLSFKLARGRRGLARVS